MAAGHFSSLRSCSPWHHRLLQASTAGCPVGARGFQRVFSGLRSCKTALTKPPSGTAPEDTICTLLFHGSPAQALQTPCSQFRSTHWSQAWHIPLQPLAFPLPLNCSTLQETCSGCSQVQLKPAWVWGKAPAPGDEVRRAPSSQAWEQAISYGKGAIQGWETSRASAWMRAQCVLGPPSLEAADLEWEILRDVGRGARMEVARQL